MYSFDYHYQCALDELADGEYPDTVGARASYESVKWHLDKFRNEHLGSLRTGDEAEYRAAEQGLLKALDVLEWYARQVASNIKYDVWAAHCAHDRQPRR